MSEKNTMPVNEFDKDSMIRELTVNLPALRARLGLSQEEVSEVIGISRQTYSSIETGKRKMTWSTFLSLILFFGCNKGTDLMLNGMGLLSPELNEFLSKNNRRDI